MPRPSVRQLSLEAARRACADWQPNLAGQVDLFEAVAEAEDEKALLEKESD